MVETLLLAVLAGVAVALGGVLLFVLFYTRSQRRSATGILSIADRPKFGGSTFDAQFSFVRTVGMDTRK